MNLRGVGRPAIGAAAAAGLVFGVLIGLTRMGWSVGNPPALGSHGPLLALGFLGTVIGMERAVALRRGWVWVVPAVAAGAIVGLLSELPRWAPAVLLTIGGVGLVGVFFVAHRLQAELHITIMGAGAACWTIGAAGLLATLEIHRLVPAMSGFLVLTILGERLELARLIGVSRASRLWLLATSVIVVSGAAVSLWFVRPGAAISGAGFLAAAGWLARKDVARRTVKVAGVTRFMAVALLLGYGWLLVAGTIWVTRGLTPGVLSYDAAVHVVFLGFVFSMVFAHTPIIVPALTGRAVPYHRGFWTPLVLLHATLALRVVGDLSAWTDGRRWGGMGNAIAIALFAVVLVFSVARGARRWASRASTP